MMMLVRICGQNWHAVERDLLSLGYRKIDVFTPKLTVWELISIVVASPPGTAVYHAETRSGVYTPEAQLLSSLTQKPAADDGHPDQSSKAQSLDELATASTRLAELPDYCGVKWEAMPVDELLAKREKLMETAQQQRNRCDRVIVDKYKGQ